MLLDRVADVHLARRCNAEGWLIKPLDSLRLKRAAKALLAGGSYTEGVPVDAVPVDSMIELGELDQDTESSEEEPVDAG